MLRKFAIISCLFVSASTQAVTLEQIKNKPLADVDPVDFREVVVERIYQERKGLGISHYYKVTGEMEGRPGSKAVKSLEDHFEEWRKNPKALFLGDSGSRGTPVEQAVNSFFLYYGGDYEKIQSKTQSKIEKMMETVCEILDSHAPQLLSPLMFVYADGRQESLFDHEVNSKIEKMKRESGIRQEWLHGIDRWVHMNKEALVERYNNPRPSTVQPASSSAKALPAASANHDDSEDQPGG